MDLWQQIDDGGEVPAYHPLGIKLQIDNTNPATECFYETPSPPHPFAKPSNIFVQLRGL